MNLIKDLYLNGCDVKKNEPLKNHTNFRVGGKVSYFIEPRTKESFIYALKKLKNEEYKIIGGGANIIAKDEFHDFFVLSTKNLSNYKLKGEKIIAECGVSITRLSKISCENNLSGLEFASGIPGSLGGAIFMNAGAYGGEFKDVVESVEIFDVNEEKIKTFSREDMKFDYRSSIVKNLKIIVLSAVLKLNIGNNVEEKTKELLEKRWERQPLDMPSAGSIFKRPKPDFYVGTTIEKLGLKGFSIGDAQISEKHAGFIVNKGNATFEDILNLIKLVKNKVKILYNMNLEVEPEIW
ncbi:UDP-N-acetylenolpyruvoylglucosamine reductase [Tepiditoga spiralis]|uniref:UDP-N-acetylenolpyruvoylglucosamine reductase n=1 Tax=Tepiditoga spiralis TaxID=2108365 RepID=A0A7G1G6J2_9BACT|nr:UDP-N-acetylmuramate dehydrogenase [Tepiditoga spiralis]BBE30497.1 UDP-N-acetylenolpyruvoylglucosamine reductase [Tepiditoga spiralis]